MAQPNAKTRDGRKTYRPDGEIRQSQLVTTFGPGAMVDLVDRAVVIGGLEHWGYGRAGFDSLDDDRLRESLIPRLRALDPSLGLDKNDYFRCPPEGDGSDPFIGNGVQALEFPRWFVCQGCRRLARAHDAFEEKRGRYRHQCAKNRSATTVPVRFVAACKRGHLRDFPWGSFVHDDDSCERHELYLNEGASGDAARIFVRCKTCDARKPMSRAAVLPFRCRGDRPWLGGRQVNESSCKEKLELLVRTASSAYFAQVVSALRLPEAEPGELARRLREPEVWKSVKSVESVEELTMLARLQAWVGEAIEGYAPDDVVRAIAVEREDIENPERIPLRSAEYTRFVEAPVEKPGDLAPEGVTFAAFRLSDDRIDVSPGVGRVAIVPELREVRVQVSFSRFDSVTANLQGEYEFDAESSVHPATLTLPTGNEKWLPAAEVRGEGLFVELDPDALSAWENRGVVRQRAAQLQRAGEQESGGEFLGVRFYLLHSLSHLLLTAISLECGYSASAIRERIYCAPDDDPHGGMSGILLSTGTTGSEGTLGGLVEEGRRIGHHLRHAWDFGRLCSNDPVCSAHDPTGAAADRRLEGAACHGCLYVAECSCERFNRYLDRALVLPTIGNDPELAFFGERP